jgi:hypothetical protein
MVAVMMRDEHATDRLARRGLLDGREERFRLERRAQRIDRHYVIVANNQARVGNALIEHAGAARLDVRENIRGELLHLSLPARRLRKRIAGLPSQERSGAQATYQFSATQRLLHYVHLL